MYRTNVQDHVNIHQLIQSGSCKDGEFACKNGECIEEHLRCNSVNDCKDESDEHNCHGKVVDISVCLNNTLLQHSLLLN